MQVLLLHIYIGLLQDVYQVVNVSFVQITYLSVNRWFCYQSIDGFVIVLGDIVQLLAARNTFLHMWTLMKILPVPIQSLNRMKKLTEVSTYCLHIHYKDRFLFIFISVISFV